MRQMRADARLELQQEQRAELDKVARSRRTPQAVAQRARIVLMTAEGISPGAIGEQLGVSRPTARKWRARYVEDGLAGLRNEPRGDPPAHSTGSVAMASTSTMTTKFWTI